jgi:hypothetical protein
VSDIGLHPSLGGLESARRLTPTAPAGHHERLMQQRCFGDWYFSFGRCPE